MSTQKVEFNIDTAEVKPQTPTMVDWPDRDHSFTSFQASFAGCLTLVIVRVDANADVTDYGRGAMIGGQDFKPETPEAEWALVQARRLRAELQTAA